MTETQVQPGHPYPESTDAAERMNLGHQLMAEFVGADIDEISISASTSFNVYVLAQALYAKFAEHEQILSKKFPDSITSRADVRLIGRHEVDKDIRVPTSSFTSEKMSSEEIARASSRLIFPRHFFQEKQSP
jgi:selenocysteine lyase/cysteine desulfurase